MLVILNSITGAVFVRSEGINPTGFHLHQAVPPVGPGHTEIVDGSPSDAEGLSLEGKLGRVGTQADLSAHPPPPAWHAGRGVPLSVSQSLNA